MLMHWACPKLVGNRINLYTEILVPYNSYNAYMCVKFIDYGPSLEDSHY
jgi:hypothetical protein